MLKSSEISKTRPETVLTDDYIPMRIIWEVSAIWPPIYWRILDTKSLLEIGIDPRTRIILSLTLTLAENIYCHSSEHIPPEIENQIGTPIFNTDEWPVDRYLDESGSFHVHLGESHILIDFSFGKDITSQIVSGRVKFGFDKEGFLRSIEVVDLNTKENLQLKSSLRC